MIPKKSKKENLIIRYVFIAIAIIGIITAYQFKEPMKEFTDLVIWQLIIMGVLFVIIIINSTPWTKDKDLE